jgi:hypothetical protein
LEIGEWGLGAVYGKKREPQTGAVSETAPVSGAPVSDQPQRGDIHTARGNAPGDKVKKGSALKGRHKSGFLTNSDAIALPHEARQKGRSFRKRPFSTQ